MAAQPALRQSWVYLLASKPNGTLYLGVTNSIERRIWEQNPLWLDLALEWNQLPMDPSLRSG